MYTKVCYNILVLKNKTFKGVLKMNVIIKEPFGTPQVRNITGNLEDLQKLVGGCIECVYDLDSENISMWCNDEGKLFGLLPNIWIYDRQDILVGTVVFTGNTEDGKTIGLTPEQQEAVMQYIDKNNITLF